MIERITTLLYRQPMMHGVASAWHTDALCVILETLLVPQSHSTDLAPELVSLGGALLTDST